MVNQSQKRNQKIFEIMNVYVINKHKTIGKDFDLNSDEDFVKESKYQGLNFTPKEFHKFFNANLGEISSKKYMIKVLDRVSYSLNIFRIKDTLPPKSIFNFTQDEKSKYSHEKYSLIYKKMYWDNNRFLTIEKTDLTAGYISISRIEAIKFFNSRYMTKIKIEKLESELFRYISEYNEWKMGNVYGYILKNFDGTTICSSYGFYGNSHDENGLIKSLPENIRSNTNLCFGETKQTVWIQ